MEGASVSKQSFRVLEIPLSRISESIPYLQNKYESQKIISHKLLSEKDVIGLRKEIPTIKRATKQLRDLSYELNSLKSQVKDEDLIKFDSGTSIIHKSIGSLMKGYTDLLKLSQEVLEQKRVEEESKNPFETIDQIQLKQDLDEIKLQVYNEKCAKVEALNKDVNEIHEIFQQLNEMAQDQRHDIENISETTESSLNNVNSGLKHLLVAHKLKGTAYPMTGVILGSILGGPVGMLAGAKIGTLAAICCGALGYTGGRILKTVEEGELVQTATEALPNDEKKEI